MASSGSVSRTVRRTAGVETGSPSSKRPSEHRCSTGTLSASASDATASTPSADRRAPPPTERRGRHAFASYSPAVASASVLSTVVCSGLVDAGGDSTVAARKLLEIPSRTGPYGAVSAICTPAIDSLSESFGIVDSHILFRSCEARCWWRALLRFVSHGKPYVAGADRGCSQLNGGFYYPEMSFASTTNNLLPKSVLFYHVVEGLGIDFMDRVSPER
jgi:hypothetical protein